MDSESAAVEPTKPKRPYHHGPKANTLKRAAALLGVDVATLKAAKDRGADGFDGYGRVRIDALRAWLAANPVSGPDGEEKETELSLKLRKLRAECVAKEFANDVKKGLYLPVSEIRENLTRAFSAVRTGVLALETLAPQLAGLPTHEVAKRIREHCRDSLQHLAGVKY